MSLIKWQYSTTPASCCTCDFFSKPLSLKSILEKQQTMEGKRISFLYTCLFTHSHFIKRGRKDQKIQFFKKSVLLFLHLETQAGISKPC